MNAGGQDIVIVRVMRGLFSLSLAAATLMAGCAQEVVGEEQDTAISSNSEELDRSSCAPVNVPVDYINAGSISYTSPQTYSNPRCYKAVVAEVDDLNAEYTLSGNARNAGIEVSYADNDLVDEASCTDAMVGGYLYRWTGSAWEFVDAEFTSGGTWHPPGFFIAHCDPPVVLFDGPAYLSAGGAYRVAVTARRESSNATRVVAISTADRVQIN